MSPITEPHERNEQEQEFNPTEFYPGLQELMDAYEEAVASMQTPEVDRNKSRKLLNKVKDRIDFVTSHWGL